MQQSLCCFLLGFFSEVFYTITGKINVVHNWTQEHVPHTPIMQQYAIVGLYSIKTDDIRGYK